MESSISYNLPNFIPNNLDKTKISRYKDIMKQKYITQWRHSVNYTRKLEFYNTFKHCYEISSYLNLTRKTINRKALVKLRVSNHNSTAIKDEIHFLCCCPKYFKLRNKFFAQIQSHLHNFQQLSYSNLVIKLMNSEDIYLNLRLTNYISLLNNLRDSILSSKNDVT